MLSTDVRGNTLCDWMLSTDVWGNTLCDWMLSTDVRGNTLCGWMFKTLHLNTCESLKLYTSTLVISSLTDFHISN